MRRPIRILFAWLAVLACVANVAAYAGGVVMCAASGNGAAIEIGCDHGHCGETDHASAGGHDGHDGHVDPDPAHHDHDDAVLCGCVACPCEDVPLAVETPRNPRHDDADVDLLVPLRFAVVHTALAAAPRARSASLEIQPRLTADARTLRSLRTIVILV